MTRIPPYRVLRIRPTVRLSSNRTRRQVFLLVVPLIGVVVLASLASTIGGTAPWNQPTDPAHSTVPANSPSASTSPADIIRNPLTWPFARNSIWNLPIGAGAINTPANLQRARDWGMTTDVDVLILTPKAPITPVYYNGDAWSGGSRCAAEGGVLFSAPIPSDFVIPGAGSGNPDGSTPNYATAILMPDGHTLVQGQPMARCSPGGTATMMWSNADEDLYGWGTSGAHGGSMLSSIGGTIRLGELIPGGVIRHAMKLNLDGVNYFGGLGAFRWPATTADSCAPGCYGGSVPAMRMGSLLALPSSIDVNAMGLETEPAKILARAFQDYGAYAVDDAAWSVYGIDTEYSPSGKVDDEFQSFWGFPISPESRDVPWARDMDRIFGDLNVVDNWDYATWILASASNGTLGAGLGAPRVAWARNFDGVPDTIAPASAAFLSGSAGPQNWYLSPVQLNVTASDGVSGVGSIHVRMDGGAWQLYTSPLTVSGDGTHRVEYFATDKAGNHEAIRSATFGIDTVGPVSSAVLSGTAGSSTWFLSPVQVTVRASDAGSGVTAIHARADGGSWTTYTNPLSLQTEGSHTVDVYATDLVGHDGAVQSTTFAIDSVPPVTTLTLDGVPDAIGSYASPVRIILTSTDATSGVQSIRYRIDSGAWWTYTNPFLLAGGGPHLLESFTTDVAGNVEAVLSRSFVLVGGPSVPPIGVFDATGRQGTNGWYVSPVTVTLSGTSANGDPTRIAYSIDGSSWAVYTSPLVIMDGRHVLQYQVADGNGNLAMVASTTVNVDSTPPVMTIVSPSGGVLSPDGPLSWVGFDSVSGVVGYELSVDGGPFQSLGTSTSRAQPWTIGSHVAILRAWDRAGNQATLSIPFRVEARGLLSGGGFTPSQPLGPSSLAVGFIAVIAALLLLKRPTWERLERVRSRRRGP